MVYNPFPNRAAMVAPMTLGQVAYESYFEQANGTSLISGSTLPRWSDQKPETKQAWENAAQAVVVAVKDYV